MRPGTFFSHTTAALLLGVPLPPRIEAESLVHVSTIAPERAPRGKGILGHKLALHPVDIVIRDGLPVPHAAEVWMELGTLLSHRELVVAGDALMRRTNPLCRAGQLGEAVAAGVARPGILRLREALQCLRPRTDSPMETILRLELGRHGLPEPEVNYAIVDGASRFIGFGDLAYPDVRVVVEYDGDHHRTDPLQYAADVDRHWRIQNAGWTIVRVNRTHLMNGAVERRAPRRALPQQF